MTTSTKLIDIFEKLLTLKDKNKIKTISFENDKIFVVDIFNCEYEFDETTDLKTEIELFLV